MSQPLPQIDGQRARPSRKLQGATALLAAVLLGGIGVQLLGFLLGITSSGPDRDTILRDRLAWLQILPAVAWSLLALGAYRLTEDHRRDGLSAALSTSTRAATVLLAGTLLARVLARLNDERGALFHAVSLARPVSYTAAFVLLIAVSIKLLKAAGARGAARAGVAVAVMHPFLHIGTPVLNAVLENEGLRVLLPIAIELAVWGATAALFWALRARLALSSAGAASGEGAPLLPQYGAPGQDRKRRKPRKQSQAEPR